MSRRMISGVVEVPRLVGCISKLPTGVSPIAGSEAHFMQLVTSSREADNATLEVNPILIM